MNLHCHPINRPAWERVLRAGWPLAVAAALSMPAVAASAAKAAEEDAAPRAASSGVAAQRAGAASNAGEQSMARASSETVRELDVRVASRAAWQADLARDLEVDERRWGGAAAGGGTGGERVVKGAPYCAEAVHETIQWLPDPGGAAPNRIVRQNVTRLCRDGEGRTRQEVERGGRRYVYLRDPVAGEGWVLDPQRKTARRLGGLSMPLDAVADAASWRDYGEQMREWARATAEAARAQARAAAAAGGAGPGTVQPRPPVPPAPPTPPVPPTPAASPAAATPGGPPPGAAMPMPVPPMPAVVARGDGAGGRDGEVTVLRRERDRDGARGDFPPPPPAVQWRASLLAPRGPGVTTALAAREVEGVRAHGERTTWVIEAGRVGNERPIQIVREVWTAPELLLTVSSRDFDPRTGEVNYRLRNLKRGEPDAEWMRVPADFTRQERGGSRGRSGPEGGASSSPRG